MKSDARKAIIKLIRQGDLAGLLIEAGKLHGHFCPGVALGVKAAYEAIIQSGGIENAGMENYLAIIECNNCFADGVQVVTGRSFGNNSLIYLDLGKTAFTLVERNSKEGIRVAVKPSGMDSGDGVLLDKEAKSLFDKVIKKREGTPEDESRLADLWKQRSFAVLEKENSELFTIENTTSEIPPFAPIFDSQICSACGEEVMETRAAFINGKPLCLKCAGVEYKMISGKGISTNCAKTNR